MLKFEEYVEGKLGDKYDIQIFPNELLGSTVKAIELTQTGAIDFAVAATANLETFADVYEIFSLPYLFVSEDAYHATMEDTDYMEKVYESTDVAGFRCYFASCVKIGQAGEFDYSVRLPSLWSRQWEQRLLR